MATEKELLERIRQLEEQNSALQDKLDLIWSVLASDYDDAADGEAEEHDDGAAPLVQITGTRKPQ